MRYHAPLVGRKDIVEQNVTRRLEALDIKDLPPFAFAQYLHAPYHENPKDVITKDRRIIIYHPQQLILPSEKNWMWSAVLSMKAPGEKRYHQVGSAVATQLVIGTIDDLTVEDIRRAGWSNRAELRKYLPTSWITNTGKGTICNTDYSGKRRTAPLGDDALITIWTLGNFFPKYAPRRHNVGQDGAVEGPENK